MPSKQTRSGFSSPDHWTKVCRQEKLHSAGRPGQGTQPDPPGTVDLQEPTMLLIVCSTVQNNYLIHDIKMKKGKTILVSNQIDSFRVSMF